MATRLYKGVGVGTFLHSHDVVRNGIPPRKPGGSRVLADFLTPIRTGTAASACISLTDSCFDSEGLNPANVLRKMG